MNHQEEPPENGTINDDSSSTVLNTTTVENSHPLKKADNGTTEADPLATVGDILSFADTWKIKLQIIVGFLFAVVSGSIYPGIFSQTMKLVWRVGLSHYMLC